MDRLDRVVIQRQRLQVSKAIEFLGFLEVLDVVTMQIECLKILELKEVSLNRLLIVVGEVEPDQVL